MKLLIPIAVLAIVVACVCADQIDRDRKWQRFKLRHNKKYADRKDEERSYERYKKNVRAIEKNQGSVSYKLKETPYTDIDVEEDHITGRGLKISDESSGRQKRSVKYWYEPSSNLYLPSSYNFMDKYGCDIVTKYQGSCGSCWAFSSTSAIEAQICKRTRKLIDLSPQYLVDCKTSSRACNGDDPRQALAFTKDNGVHLENDYPYQGRKAYCQNPNRYKRFTTSETLAIKYHEGNDAENIRLHKSALVEHGPIVICMYSSVQGFMSYGGGMFDDRGASCGRDIDHAVLLVGYGRENGVDYWLIKNSWGMDWGEDGYFKMPMSTCSLYTYSTVPVIDSNLGYDLSRLISSSDIEDGDPSPRFNFNFDFNI